MCVLLRHEYLGNTHVCKLMVRRGQIYCDRQFLSQLNLIKEYFNWLFYVVRRLNHALVFH